MRPHLLDVNVLLALAWPVHVHHVQAQEWFRQNRTPGFRTCPLTQLAFVRISSNPAFSRAAVAPGAALALLREIVALPDHGFWPDTIDAARALEGRHGIVGHRQVTDAYLLALAAEHDGVIATLDRGLLAVAGDDADRVVLV